MSDSTSILELTEETLLNEAKRQAGLSDFGDTWFLEPMRKLLDSIHKEAKLSPQASPTRAAESSTAWSVASAWQDALKRHPKFID